MDNIYQPLRLLSIIAIIVRFIEVGVTFYVTVFHFRHRKKLGYFALTGVLSLMSFTSLFLVSKLITLSEFVRQKVLYRFVYHFTYAEFIVLLLILISILPASKFSFYIKATLLAFTLFALIDTSTGSTIAINHFDKINLFISFHLIITCLAVFSTIINANEVISLGKSYKFRFTTTVFIYYSASMPLNYFYNKIESSVFSKDHQLIIFTFISMFYISLYLLLTSVSKCKIANP